MATIFTLGPWAPPPQPSTSISAGTNFLAAMAKLAQTDIPSNPQYQTQATTSIFQSRPRSVGGGPPRREYPEYYPPKSGVDPTKTLSHFHLLLSLPIEIIGLIVSHCPATDSVCFSLTSFVPPPSSPSSLNLTLLASSKHLYRLSRPIILRRFPTAYRYGGTRRGVPLCVCPGPPLEDGQRIILPRPPTPTSCKKRGCKSPKYTWDDNTSHCSICSSCPLWERLKLWVPRTLRFCTDRRCNKFLNRGKLWKGRCLHKGPRPKKRKEGHGSLTWTHLRGFGGWQRNGKMWKSLYTEADMRKAMDRYTVPRSTASGYSLRQRPRPTEKRREHMVTRGCAVVTVSGMYSEWSRRMKWTNWIGAPVTRTEWEWVNKRTGEVRFERPTEEEEFNEETDGDEEMDSEMDEE